MRTRTLTSTLIIIVAILICLNAPVHADRGSIPFNANVQIFEPNQRALIAWNGFEEILILTTDLYASKSTKVLEVLPLPTEPEVTKGDIGVFHRATNLINEHLRQASRQRSRSRLTKSAEPERSEPAGEITFHEKIGAHNISVAHVLNSQGFITWVDEYLKSEGVENPQIPVELKTVISEYLEVGFVWFVFDVVQLGRAPKTNEAIQYRFFSTVLYYPLKITRTEEGDTTIDLIILTPEVSWDHVFFGIPEYRIDIPHDPILLTTQEVIRLHKDMYDFFGYPNHSGSGPWLETWQIVGELSSFENDLIVANYSLITDVGVKSAALIRVVKQGRIDIVNFLLAEGADANARDKYGWTVLMNAAQNGHTEVVQVLLQAGAGIYTRNAFGETALMKAAEGGHSEILQMLLIAGDELCKEDGEKALMQAAKRGHFEIVQILVEEGVEVNTRDEDGETALMWAAKNGRTIVVQVLLQAKAEMNSSDGNRALMEAARRGYTGVVQELLEAGAEINAGEGDKALIEAASSGPTESVEALLHAGANINARDEADRTPLIHAAKNGQTGAVQILIKEGADVNADDKDNVTALMVAAQNGHTDIVQVLLETGAQIISRDRDGDTVLMLAVENGHTEVVQLLLEVGAELSVEDGDKALMEAARLGLTDTVEALLKAGVNVNARDEDGRTPLMIAAGHGHIFVVHILRRSGADIKARDKHGWTAARYARQGGHREILPALR